ncbi:MAG: hypothetical protein HY865_13875 [Chloroflexi bacterium]|nr:hypothetical protein [Chloroflexota bacterium]
MLVFDTGGNCKANEFLLASLKRSVVIASAISLYQYIQTWEAVPKNRIPKISYVLKAFEKEYPNRPWKEIAPELIPEMDINWDTVNNEYSKIEPTDETGRYKQMALLLRKLNEVQFDLTKTPAGGLMGKVDALGCTLGPLGCLWWGQDKSKPIWTHVVPVSKPNSNDISGQCLPLSEIRNALGCGDISRGGYIASIVVQGSGLGDFPIDQRRGFEAMVWAGTCRIMFWDIREFGKWLQNVSVQALDWLRGNVQTPPWPDVQDQDIKIINEQLQPIRNIVHVDLLDIKERNSLMGYVKDWEKKILSSALTSKERLRDTRSQEWKASIEEWRRARKLKFTR